MPSLSSKILYQIMRRFKFNQILKKSLDEGTISNASDKPHRYIRPVAPIETLSIDGCDVFILRAKKGLNKPWILYLHGGAYVHGFQSFHWRFLKTVIKKTGWNIIAPDYPLLPHHTSKDMYDVIKKTYECLIHDEHPSSIVFMGDSAGGGLALGFAQWLTMQGMRSPDEIILLSPWLDISMNDEKIKEIEPLDPILNVDALRQIGQMLALDNNPKNYLYSPLYGDLKGIKTIRVITGTYDLLYADALRLSDHGKQQGTVIVYPFSNMVHTFMFFGLSESKLAMNIIVKALSDINT